MISFILVCGLFLLLKLPIIGAVLFKGIQHGLLHLADHHEHAFLYSLSAFLVSLVLLAAVSLLLGCYWIAGDVVVVILVLRSLLRHDQGH